MQSVKIPHDDYMRFLELTRRKSRNWKPTGRMLVTAFPIIICNLVAVLAQYSFFRANLPDWGTLGAGLFATALESIAIFLAYMGHEALKANDSALRLRLASYLMGMGIGAINASHFIRHGTLTVEAVSVGLLSASSAPLWGIYSRRNSRDMLKTLGLIEDHAIRLGGTRWMMHPIRSMRLYWLVTWEGINTIPEAMTAYGDMIRLRQARRKAQTNTHPNGHKDVAPQSLAEMVSEQ
jgi:hypothetical protein